MGASSTLSSPGTSFDPLPHEASMAHDLASPVRPTPHRGGFDPPAPRQHVQHYAVAHFRAIREAFGISAESFAAAFRLRHIPPRSCCCVERAACRAIAARAVRLCSWGSVRAFRVV